MMSEPASGSHVQARNAADKPLSKRQARPTPSRKASTSKLPEQPACCSESSEVVLICCDSPDCVADDVPVCSSDAGAPPDDCAECQQAAETGCTGDCLVEGAVGSADDCPECLQEERQDKSVNNKINNASKSSRILSATEAFDAEEPIQACDVPGCDALEWDEKAVDELLRCCCSSSEHHHQSFAIPSSHNTAPGHIHIPKQHQHSHSNALHTSSQNNGGNNAALPSFPPPTSSHAFHAHHQYHAHCPELPPYNHIHSSLRPPSTASDSCASQSTNPVDSVKALPFLSNVQSDYNSSQFAQPSDSYPATATAYTQLQEAYSTSLVPLQASHSRSHSLPSMNMHFQSQPASGGVLISRTETSSNTANPTFQCQWSSCSACFPTREELVGHVNVTHLLQAKATAPNQDCTPPTPAQSGVSGLSRLSETRDGSTDMDLSTYSPSQNPGSANNMPSSRQADSHAQTSAGTNLNIFGGHLQNQPTDASFDHTLRCLWDSCEASVPILAGNLMNNNQPVDGHVSGQLPAYQSSGGDNVMKIAPHVPFQTLPDQSTASLVRHLLQDHLHLPTDVLGQMSPGLSIPQANVQQVHTHPVSGPELSNNLSRHNYDVASAPSSNHSTPYSLPKLSAVNTPVNYKPPPTPPLASAEQQFRFDFGLPSIEAFNSWSAPVTGAEQTKSEEKPQPSAEQIELKSESHACRWKGCSAVYANTADLMEHISSEHIGSGKSMYHCEWEGCDRAHEGRGFNQRQKVMRHVRTHVGDRPYVCTECGRAFSESTTLASHMRTHTNEKPFMCPEPGCGKTFALQSALTIHMRVHTGEKPFKCPHCEMAFAESSNLSKHVKTHLPRTGSSGPDRKSAHGIAGRKRHYDTATEADGASYVETTAKMLKA